MRKRYGIWQAKPAYRKKYKKIKKTLAFTDGIEYNNPCCDIDSVEAKVAMHIWHRFFVERMSINDNWRQVTVLNNHLAMPEMTCEDIRNTSV